LIRDNVVRGLIIFAIGLAIVQSVGSVQKAGIRDLFFGDATKNYAIAFGIEGRTTINESAMGMVDLTLSKEYPTSFWPIEQQYVMYDLRIHDIGTNDIQNQILWMRFTSKSGMTLHESKYPLPLMHPGDYALLHLGPLKMHDSSSHMLFVGINEIGDSSTPNSVGILNSDPATPIDSFQVFEQLTLERILVGSILSISGLGIVVSYFVFRRSSKKSVSFAVDGKVR